MPKEPEDLSSVSLNKIIGTLGNVNFAAGGHIEATLSLLFEGLKKGIMPKQALQIDEMTIEKIYSQAYTLYNQGKYNEARALFIVLMMIDPTVPKHMMGCGACLHRLKIYEKAAQIYLLCATLDVDNPFPHFHAADCYIRIQAPELAEFCLKNAIACAKEKQEYAVVKERATRMLESVQVEVQARARGEFTQKPLNEEKS